MHAQMHPHKYIYTHVCPQDTCTDTQTHKQTHAHTNTDTFTQTNIDTFMYAHIHMHTCTYMHMVIHIHTSMNAHTYGAGDKSYSSSACLQGPTSSISSSMNTKTSTYALLGSI